MSQLLKNITLGASLLASTGIASMAFAGQQGPAYEPSLLPADPQAGQCYARVHIPAEYSTTSENVMTVEGYNTLHVEQAQLASRQEQIEIKEASVRYEVRQPQYRTVSERVMVRPGYDKLSVSKPTFNTVQENIQTTRPRTVWKLGNPGALIAQGYNVLSTADAGHNGQGYSSTQRYGENRSSGTACGPTCEIWCLVEEPGETITYNRKVMTSPGAVQRTPVAPKYSTISKQVVSDPGGVREIPVAAQYRGMTVEDIVSPGGVRETYIQPEYSAIDTKELVSESRYEWRRVICQTGSQNPRSGGRVAAPYNSGSSSYNSGSSSSYGTNYGSTYSSGSTYGTGASTNTNSSYSSSSQPITYGGSGSTSTNAYGTNSHGLDAYESGGSYNSGSTTSYGNGQNTSYGSGSTGTYGNTYPSSNSNSVNTGTYYYGSDKPVSETTNRHHRHKD